MKYRYVVYWWNAFIGHWEFYKYYTHLCKAQVDIARAQGKQPYLEFMIFKQTLVSVHKPIKKK